MNDIFVNTNKDDWVWEVFCPYHIWVTIAKPIDLLALQKYQKRQTSGLPNRYCPTIKFTSNQAKLDMTH